MLSPRNRLVLRCVRAGALIARTVSQLYTTAGARIVVDAGPPQ